MIYDIKTAEVTTINQDQIGLVEAKYGKSLEKGENFGRKVDCDNFQDAQTFLEEGGQAGKQLVHLEAGKYYINTEIFNVRKVPIISIRPGEIGLVIANYGVSKPVEQIFGKVVECNDFQDAEAFLNSGGQRGKQLAILRAGKYKINTDLFTVITTDNSHEHKEHSDNLKVRKIDKDKIGIVTTMTGKTLPKDEIAGREIDGHNNYQDGQKFLDLGGERGLQEEVLKEGEWNLNPWFVKVEQVPVTKIEQEEVGVVISSVGKKYDRHDDEQSSSQYQLVDPGYKGVENKPLTANTYPINTRIKEVKRVPTTHIILNWSDEKKNRFNYDYKLKTIKLISLDGYEISVEFTQIIRIAPENAPKMICLVGAEGEEDKKSYTDDKSGQTVVKYPAIRNLVSRVLAKEVSSYFRQAATGKTAIEFQEGRVSCQREAEIYINDRLAEIGVEGCGTVIDEVNLPEELDKYRQRLEKQKQEKEEAQAKVEAEKKLQELVKAEKDREEIESVRDAEIRSKVSQMDAYAKSQKEQLDLETYQKELDIRAAQEETMSRIELDALRAKVRALSPEIYAQIETQRKWADALTQAKITLPQIMVTGGNNNGSGDSASNLLNLLQIEHLTGLASHLQLNQGTSTPLLSKPETKNSLPPNQEQKSLPANSAELKIPVVFVVDTSTSMSGERIDSLNAGIAAFKKEFEPSTKISQSVQLAIITSNSNRREIQDFVNMDEFAPSPLKAEGKTMIGKGINLALREIENYQNNYQSNNIQHSQKPWLFYILGIPPTDTNWQTIDKDWQKSTQRAKEAAEANKLNFFLVGVEGVDIINLREIASLQTPRKSLNSFPELFHWIAENLKKVSTSEKRSSAISILPITESVQDEN
ncbi:SPFH domain-containing protein [Hydrocoleum sp. CS-953]|uniref:SPFH domain-containing protein n=1 Tax=Hydrocoleum sp. CS-953 TaxID=1671698 RepID=UPI000B9B8EEC|nr:SPFH domain-containing protein [Hydrocoleum sp. CS-953]